MHTAFTYDRKNYTRVTRSPCKIIFLFLFQMHHVASQHIFSPMFLSKIVRMIKQNLKKRVSMYEMIKGEPLDFNIQFLLAFRRITESQTG